MKRDRNYSITKNDKFLIIRTEEKKEEKKTQKSTD